MDDIIVREEACDDRSGQGQLRLVKAITGKAAEGSHPGAEHRISVHEKHRPTEKGAAYPT